LRSAAKVLSGFLGVWLELFSTVLWAQSEPVRQDGGDVPAAHSSQDGAAASEGASHDQMLLEEPQRPRYLLEVIRVTGNEKTRGDLIISWLLLKPGEAVEEEKVEESRVKLLATGYFRDVRMRLEKGSRRGWVALIIEVEERNTIIIDDIFFGWSQTDAGWGGLGISDINFLGRGMVLSAAGVGSNRQQAGRLGLFWPSVFNSRFQAGFSTLFVRGEELALAGRIYSCSDCSDPCKNLGQSDIRLPYWRAGGEGLFGIRLDRSHRLLITYHGEHIEADVDSLEYCPNHPFKGYLRPGPSTYSSFKLQFERDTRNDFFFPSSGMLFTVSVELASKIFGSDYEFSKYELRYEHSFPGFADHAWRLSVMGGLIQDVGERGSPFFTRFFVGDYAFFLIKKDSLPRNLELNFSPVFDYGDLMASLTAEYDIPLWQSGRFFYRGFVYLAGNFSLVTKASFLASDEEWSGRTKRPFSLDAGIKTETPIGLLSFSLGYLLDLSL